MPQSTHCVCEADEAVQSCVVDSVVVEVERGMPCAEGVAWCHMTRHMLEIVDRVSLHNLCVQKPMNSWANDIQPKTSVY